MINKYSTKGDLYKDFLLCVKFRTKPYYSHYKQFYDLLDDMGWTADMSIEHVEEDIVHREDDYVSSGALLADPEGEYVAFLEHETGAEFWIIPIVTFVGGAIASGVIGNAAYDLIRKLHTTLNKAQKTEKQDEPDDYFRSQAQISIVLRTPGYETVDLTQLPLGRRQEILEQTVQNRLKELKIQSDGEVQLSVERRPLQGLQGLERRIRQLEDQVGTLALRHLELETEFQKERTEWRRRSAHTHRQVNTKTNSQS